DATWIPTTIHSFTILMSYSNQAPFYADNQVLATFEIRIRESSLALDTEPETTPYLDDVTFIVFYRDTDAGGTDIAGSDISIVGFTEITDYLISEGSPGYYTITVFTTSLGSLDTHVLDIQAVWTGAPYHADAALSVSVLVRARATNLEVTVPPAQTLYLDDVTFEFEFNDLDAGIPITSLDTSLIHLYWSNMTEIPQLDYNIIESSGTYELTVSSTILSHSTVTGLSIRVVVDWPEALTPFYADDFTIVKVTITGRSILVETEQINRTPRGDTLNITINLFDLDTGDPIAGAIILFSCRDHFLQEGDDYIYTPGLGTYTFNVNTMSLSGTGAFLFDLTVKWNPSLPPFYSNRSTTTLTGIVDLVRTSLQVDAIAPSSVQYTGDVSMNITWTDLDHGGPVTGFASQIESNIKYYISGLPPASLSVYEYGSTGIYNISFSTDDPGVGIGSYTLIITAQGGIYAAATVTPQFSVIEIETELVPFATSLLFNWTDTAVIYVDYNNLLDKVQIPGAIVSWWIGSVFGGYLDEPGVPGQYRAVIDTEVLGSGTKPLTIEATLENYKIATTTVTLVILALPSDIIFINPAAGVLDVPRGNPIPVSVRLNDTERGIWIDDLQINEIYVTFLGVQYPLTWFSQSSTWNVTIPGSATILDPGNYEVRITTGFDDYQSAGDQFRINIQHTETHLIVLDPEDKSPISDVDTFFAEEVHIALNLTERAYNTTITDASVYWYSKDFSRRLNFTYNSTLGLWELKFNTSLGFYGTWGLTFTAIPNDPLYAQSSAAMTLTIARRTTEVIAPAVRTEVEWGWSGNISFTYYDTVAQPHRGIVDANVLYDYGPFTDLPALSLGNGTYLVFINTTYLGSDTQYRIIIDFAKANFEERTSGTNIRIDLRQTELLVSTNDPRTYENSGDTNLLEIPMNDVLNITFFFNDISNVGGLSGGLDDAIIRASLSAPAYFSISKNVTLLIERLGNGWYYFIFDTNNLTYYETNEFIKNILAGDFYLTIRLEALHRFSKETSVRITIIEVQTEYILEYPTDFNMTHGETLIFRVYVNDTWHIRPVIGASISATYLPAVIVIENGTTNDGWYYIVLSAEAAGGSGRIEVTISMEFHETISFQIFADSLRNSTDEILDQITRVGLPISLLVITLLGLYVRVWSVPKRIRQINGQLKSLRKGKVPKPITDVKSRQQLAAELFNDTFEKLKITRSASQMPEDAIPIEVPEMGELLIQLAILTNLSPEELDEFQADINKMKMSEQAAFVREVIMQEAIRAARRDGRTVEETLALIEQEAQRRLGADEDVKPVDVLDTGPEEMVFLEDEEPEKVIRKEEKTLEEEVAAEEVPETSSEKMSLYEIEELRKDLERRGVPPHEIETIIEQAKELPRELVEELVKSLEGRKD
ncbi:MAG: hypothetical protein ACFFCX_13785, partial [Candidatus Sifarchaeia archaeon]